MTEDDMVGCHHWLNGHGFGWTSGVGDGQGSLACCASWGRKESDMTEWLNSTEPNVHVSIYYRSSYVELLDQKIGPNFTKLFSKVIPSHAAKCTCEFFWSTYLTTLCVSVVQVYRHLMVSSYFYWRYMMLYIFCGYIFSPLWSAYSNLLIFL